MHSDAYLKYQLNKRRIGVLISLLQVPSTWPQQTTRADHVTCAHTAPSPVIPISISIPSYDIHTVARAAKVTAAATGAERITCGRSTSKYGIHCTGVPRPTPTRTIFRMERCRVHVYIICTVSCVVSNRSCCYVCAACWGESWGR